MVNFYSNYLRFCLAFLFLDMATLTIFYGVLFFFLRAQLTKGLRTQSNTTDQQRTEDLTTTTNPQWEVSHGTSYEDIEASAARPSGPVLITRFVSISTQDAQPRTPRPQASTQQTYRRINKVSITLLIYPLLYTIMTMPICIARIAEFAGQDLGLPFTYFGAALFECTGLVNVLLYTSTRKGLVSWDRLAFWNKAKHSGEQARRASRGAPSGEVLNLERVRMGSKTSASSIAGLKEEISISVAQDAAESDAGSHLEH